MFKNSEPPMSLFSFQDIITSLTGIMIFFLLLLALNILNTAEAKQEESPLYQEIAYQKERKKLQEKQIAELSGLLKDYRRRISSIEHTDGSTLRLKHFSLAKLLKKLEEEQIETVRNTEQEQQKESGARLKNDRLEKRRQELNQKKQENDLAAEQNRQKKKQIEQERSKPLPTRRIIDISIDSSIDKTPLVITCSKDSITIKGKGVRDRQITQTSRKNLELENKLMYELNAFDQNQYYFVFLVKPSASDYFMRVLTRFLGLKKNADYGMEAISEREDL